MNLFDLGWTEREAAAFAPYGEKQLVPARVAVAYGATFRVYLEHDEMLADASGRLRHDARNRRDMPAVGDWVAVRRGARDDRASIQAILPRKSVFSRKVAGEETVEQIVAANVDTAFIVAGLDRDLNLRRLERYLAMTRSSGARPVIVLNKSDIAPDLGQQRAAVEAMAMGVSVHAISSRLSQNLEELEQYLQRGQTVALVGSSGVGKSTLINRLLGIDRQRTEAVREKDQRGRHTTSHRELVPLPGGALLIDTPGMRELQLWDADEGIGEVFDDIRGLASGCYFRDCSHDTEPRCAVKTAVEEGRLPAARVESYLKLQRELRHLVERQDALAMQQEKARTKTVHRAVRKHLKDKGSK
jgi:ribosome biogenesis GTPase